MEIITYRDYNDLMIIIEHETKSWCTYDMLLNWFLIQHWWINLTSMIALFFHYLLCIKFKPSEQCVKNKLLRAQ